MLLRGSKLACKEGDISIFLLKMTAVWSQVNESN